MADVAYDINTERIVDQMCEIIDEESVESMHLAGSFADAESEITDSSDLDVVVLTGGSALTINRFETPMIDTGDVYGERELHLFTDALAIGLGTDALSGAVEAGLAMPILPYVTNCDPRGPRRELPYREEVQAPDA